jgi:hypothetical protein
MFVRFCGAIATHVYGGRCGGALSPRRVGSGIKIIGIADNFYGAREGAALPLYEFDLYFYFLCFIFYVLI